MRHARRAGRLTLTGRLARATVLLALGASVMLAAGLPAVGSVQAAQDPGRAAVAAAPRAATFSRDIAPIILASCSPCHRPGGGAPFALLTYEDVRQRGAAIATAVSRRLMPPWKPVAGYGAFVGERRLTDDQIRLIQQWVDNGAPEGVASVRPEPPHWVDGWRLGDPDVVVEMPEYLLAPGRGDVYRNFALPIPIEQRQYVRGLEFRQGTPGVVHHANMRIDCTDRSRELDRQDPAPGYEAVSLESATRPEGYFLGWTPGQVSPLAPEDLSWPLETGCDLVLEMHLRSTQAPARVTANVGFYFSERAATRTPSLIRLGFQDIDIPAGRSDHTISHRYVLPVDVEVHSVQPHAHYLAREIRAFATLPDGSVQWLLYIDAWDFDWQDVYRYARPFWLPKGSTLAIEFTYDNSVANPRNPHTPPQRVRYGQRSTDEMGFLWLQVVTRTPGERAILNDEIWHRNVSQDIVGLETLVEIDPADWRLYSDLAYFHLQLGHEDSALAYWRETIRLAPESASGYYDLGTLLMNQGRLAEAAANLREAARLDPGHSDAHNNLGGILVRQGDVQEAVGHFRAAIEARPGNAEARSNLARQLDERGDVGEALTHYQAALALGLDDTEVYGRVASLLARERRFGEAIEYYEAALTRDANLVPALVDLAWILSTAPGRIIAAPDRAIQLAERARRVTEQDGRADPLILETLALAYAAGQRFDEAIAVAEVSVTLAASDERTAPMADELRRRLAEWKRLREAGR